MAKILFLSLLANAVMAPVVYAANQETISRSTAYSIGALVIVAIGLAAYLTFVIFQPEKL
ncbi:potassium-transporting ATPase subunit F [Synechococcus elongatus IITB7]|uniref:potassium-transporting ATPase subunit F n=1 Tax=Synechococcus elongatus TaxID=32046 RepID=UPI0030D043B7